MSPRHHGTNGLLKSVLVWYGHCTYQRTEIPAYPTDRRTDFSEAAPAVARRDRRGAAVDLLAHRPRRRSRRHYPRDAWRTRVRFGCWSVVVLLQPSALG